jgi:PHD/YefM family antitoxin component YafN of YafNO toxin-antitoxin module
MKCHHKILKKNGEKAFVVLPYEEFVKVQEALEDYEDLKTLRAAKSKEATSPTTPLLKVRKQFGI